MDHVDKNTRSEIMAKVKSKDTGPEMQVRRSIHRAGFRFRLHRTDLPGSPDLLFPRHKIALFVHGCFWHAHGCKKSRIPKSNVSFWSDKIRRNVSRDQQVRNRLELLGWKWRVIWQCDLADGIKRVTLELDRAWAANEKGSTGRTQECFFNSDATLPSTRPEKVDD